MNTTVISLFKSPLLVMLSLLLSASCSEPETSLPATEPEAEDPVVEAPWNLIFEDNFDRDLNQWNIWYGGAFNQEIQLYREEQLELVDGVLKIQAQREAIVGPTNIFDPTPKSFEYVSGRIESQPLFGPTLNEGTQEIRMMARIKLPEGHGMWPAFWSYGDPWPTQGEIDILEARGGEVDRFQSNLFYGPNPNQNINSGTEKVYVIGGDLTDSFHTYEMIWRATSIEIIFDGELLHTYTANATNNVSNMLGKQQKVVLNTAVGGLFFGDQNSANYADSSTMEIDWVRVYRR